MCGDPGATIPRRTHLNREGIYGKLQEPFAAIKEVANNNRWGGEI